MKRFFERDHDIRFDVGAAFGGGSRASTSKICSPTSPTEERLEKIAEARAAEFEFDTAAIRASPTLEATARLSAAAPTGRWFEASGLIPIGAQLIVFPALL